MPRPPSNVDKLMIQAGLELISETGISGLTVRQVVKRAKVNLGLFHYHFKSKEAFARRVLQAGYEDFFSRLTTEAAQQETPLKQLELSLINYAFFMRDNRHVVVALLKDSLVGFAPSAEFLGEKTLTHNQVFIQLIKACQATGSLRPDPPERQAYFLVGATASLVLTGTMLDKSMDSLLRDEAVLAQRKAEMYGDEAIKDRIRWALAALAPSR
jgi:AcrR family transcriptional regulator